MEREKKKPGNVKAERTGKTKKTVGTEKQNRKRKDKSSSSLVIRINMKMALRMLGMFLLLDLIIISLFFFSLYVAEGTFSMNLEPKHAIMLFRRFLSIVGIAELLIVMFNLGANARTIYRELKPLNELAQTARALNRVETLSPEEINRLMGALDNINASHLDTRIPAETMNDELKPLAAAINEMLARIDRSYRSQLRFVSDASHELRTPIAVIQGYANLLDRWGKEDPKTLQESIDAIRGESETMKALVEQLLFLARGDNETMKLEVTEFNLSILAEEVLREIQMIDEGHSFRGEIQKDVVMQGDEGLVKQLMRILLDNSMKYTPPEGEIKLRIRRESAASEKSGKSGVFEKPGKSAEFGKSGKSTVQIMVQDEGQGIPPEALPHIFERFYRADESRDRKSGGAGLGLSIAKWIVEKHGGVMEVVSRQGIGTRFTIRM